MHHRKIAGQAFLTLFLLALLVLQMPAVAQTRITSPYSYYGLGELRFNQNIRNLGMGGLGIGFRSRSLVNDVNPASYTAIDSMSFLFEANLFSHFYTQKTETQGQSGNYTALGNLMFGTQLTRWWAAGFGLKPFSSMGYKIRDHAVDDTFGQMNFLYEGKGGVNQVFIGTAVTPFKGFSVGLNASYLFGALERSTTIYSDTTGVFLTNRVLSNRVNGWHFGMGMQYHRVIGENGGVTVGLIYGHDQEVKASRTETIRRGQQGSAYYDTLSVAENVAGHMLLPGYWGGGLFVRFSRKWQAGVDYQQQKWSGFEMVGRPGGLSDNYQFAAGIQYNPAVTTYSNIFSVMDYRAGIRYGQTYLNPKNHALDEFGIGFGLGIPLRLTLSRVNVGFEFSRRGTTDHDLLKENFYRINIGVNVHERWFLRRRFF